MLIRWAVLFGVLVARGQDLPSASAETLDGKKVDFPAALRGSISVCVFGFGRETSDKVGVWLENLTADGVNAWSVVNIESTPAPARMVVRMTMRRGTPAALLGRSLVIAKDAKAWKQLLEVTKESLPVVVLLDAEGHIAWKRQGTFSGAISDEMKAQIVALATR
jgi:hypothetical protein